jgi:hypothetical protein
MILVLFILFLFACGSGSKPQEIKTGTGGFSIETPITLKEEPTQILDTSFCKVYVHLFSADKGSKSYFAAYYDYPPDVISKVAADKIFDRHRDVMMSHGKLLNEKKISLEGNPGRELEVSANMKDGVYLIKSRSFLVGNHFYDILVRSSKNVSDSSDVKFLNSFKLLGK